MARSITIQSIDRRAGVTYINLAGKHQVEIPGNVEALKAWIRSQFSEQDDLLLAIALAAYLARDPDLTNPGMIVGRTLTIDLAGRLNYPDSVLRVS